MSKIRNGVCECCAADNKRLVRRSFWTTGLALWMCGQCRRMFAKTLNRPAKAGA